MFSSHKAKFRGASVLEDVYFENFIFDFTYKTVPLWYTSGSKINPHKFFIFKTKYIHKNNTHVLYVLSHGTKLAVVDAFLYFDHIYSTQMVLTFPVSDNENNINVSRNIYVDGVTTKHHPHKYTYLDFISKKEFIDKATTMIQPNTFVSIKTSLNKFINIFKKDYEIIHQLRTPIHRNVKNICYYPEPFIIDSYPLKQTIKENFHFIQIANILPNKIDENNVVINNVCSFTYLLIKYKKGIISDVLCTIDTPNTLFTTLSKYISSKIK